MFETLSYFFRFLINRFKEKKCPSDITLKNNLPEDKKKYIDGSISLCHCRGYDCIIVVIYLVDFTRPMDVYIQICYIGWTIDMGCIFSKMMNDALNVQALDFIPQEPEFDY